MLKTHKPQWDCRALFNGLSSLLFFIYLLAPVSVKGAAVNLVLTGSTTMSGASTTVTLCDSVDLSSSVLLFTMNNNSNAVGNNLVTGELTNEETLTFRRDGTGSTVSISWQVIEFSSGVTVQRGTSVVNATTFNQSITAVGSLANSFPIINMSNNGSSWGTDDGVVAELTSTANLQFRTASANFTVRWQVVEYDSCDVQSFNISLSGTSATATLSGVTTNKTMLVGSHSQSGGINADDMPRIELTNSTTVTATRVGSASTITYFGYAIEFTDNTSVQHGSFSFGSGATNNTQAITAIQEDRSIVFGPGHFGNQGSTSHSADDNIGHNWCSMNFASTTSVSGTRGTSGSTATVPFEVVSFRFNQTDPPTFSADLIDPAGPFGNMFLNSKETGSATITAGSTSTTATISPVDVDSTFFIFSVRNNSSTIGAASIRGELTNSTTLTFERADVGTAVEIEYQVFYFATGVYVQHGTTTMNATSTDQPINSVDLEKTFVLASFMNSGSTFGSDDAIVADLTTSTNLQLRSIVTLEDDASWQVIEMQDALVRKVDFRLESGSTSTTSGISALSTTSCGESTPTLNGVDTAHTFVVSSHTNDANARSDDLPRLQITDTNEVTATRVGSTGNLDFVAYVVELFDESDVVRGNISITGTNTTAAGAISSVSAKSSGIIGPSNLGRQASTTFDTDDDLGYCWVTYTLNSSTEVGVTRAGSSTATTVVPYQVISFTNFRCPPLPIELHSFNVTALEGPAVEINWRTLSETNNDYFTTERSRNAVDWQALSRVKGVGNSSVPLNYQAFDFHPYQGINYYRLKQTDFNGQFEHFTVKSATISVEHSAFKVYPNPTNGNVTIEGRRFELDELNVYTLGKKNVTKEVQLTYSNENSSVTIELSDLEPGVYLIQSKTAIFRIIKL